MAKNENSPAVETGVAQEAPADVAKATHDHDRIVIASRGPDGRIRQFEPEFIGPKEAAEEAAKAQLREQRVSAVDVAIRGTAATVPAAEAEPDPVNEELRKAHEEAAKAGEAQATAEVGKLHK